MEQKNVSVVEMLFGDFEQETTQWLTVIINIFIYIR